MPKYDYYCVDCKKNVEIEKSYTDTSPFKCPSCKGKRLVRKITTPNTVLYKGDGWTKQTQVQD
jgi:putative FmdB family regulatory protein